MDKWIVPTILILILISIFFPYLLLMLILFSLLYFGPLIYFNFSLPPPYLSVTTDLLLQINWISRIQQKTKLVLFLDKNNKIELVPDHITTNEFTGKYSVNSKVLKELNQLPPLSKINYQIVELGEKKSKILFGGKKYWFNLPSAQLPQKPLKIAVLGDLQPKKPIPPLLQWYIMNQVKRTQPDFFLYLGDHTMEGLIPEGWRQFYHVIGKIAKNIPILGIPGNHDIQLKRKGEKRLIEAAYLTYVNYPEPKNRYFLKLYGINILAFDFLNNFSEQSQNYALLQESLPKMEPKDWSFVLWHSSPYNTLKSNTDVEFIRDKVIPKLETKQNHLWLGGHEHSYQKYKVNQTYYITTAATSSFHHNHHSLDHMEKLILKFHFVLLKIDEHKIQVQVIGLDNKYLDEFTIQKN